MEIAGYDINGVIDLIINDGDGVSLVHFIRTREEMKSFHAFYMELLSFYAISLKENEDINVENLILYVLDESKIYETEFNKNEFVLDYLESIVKNIDNNDYSKHTVHCDKCEFSSLICKSI